MYGYYKGKFGKIEKIEFKK